VRGRRFSFTGSLDSTRPGCENRRYRNISGLFYCGDQLALGKASTRKYAINPQLPVSPSMAEISGNTLPFRPSYANISPEARRAFLDWMSSGRKDPFYGIGFVLIFFYGLEHRVFVDRLDTPLIIAEVERLLSIYGDRGHLDSVATKFLKYARISQGRHPQPPPFTPMGLERATVSEMGFAILLDLGRKLSQDRALSAEDALRWVVASQSRHLRASARYCFEEFSELWKLRFDRLYPGGLRLNVKRAIRLYYRISSQAFDVDVNGEHQRYPDISYATKHLDSLQKMVEECIDALDAYSKTVRREPAGRRWIAAASLLPADLRHRSEIAAVEEFRRRVEAVLGGEGRGVSTAGELLVMAGIRQPADGRISTSALDALGWALDRSDVGIEPDGRYGSSIAHYDEPVCVFRAAAGGPIDASRMAFLIKRMGIEIAALAVAGDAAPEELEPTIVQIENAIHLSGVEQDRLAAFAVTLVNNPGRQERVMAELAELGSGDSEIVTDAAIAVIAKRHGITASEAKFLERIDTSLGPAKERIKCHPCPRHHAVERAGARQRCAARRKCCSFRSGFWRLARGAWVPDR